MPSSTVENYVKQMYLLEQELQPDLVPMGRMAASLGITPGTATTMVKALAESGLADYEPRSGVRLTEGGRRLALHVLRRHRLVEAFLVKTLGLDWSEVHEEAEQLEHVISDKVLERIDVYLNRPRRDPHGDPIPDGRGRIDEAREPTLNDCSLSSPWVVVRIHDQEPEFLQFVERIGLTPGGRVEVCSRDRIADAVTFRNHHAKEISVSTAVAAKIAVAAPPNDVDTQGGTK